MLAQRFPHIYTACGQERIRHPAANDQMIDLGHQMTKHRELGRDLGTAYDRRDRPLRIAERLTERVELGFHRPSRKAWKIVSNSLRRGMSPVRSREGVVDIIVTERRHRLGELGIIPFLAFMETRVLEDSDISRQHRCNGTRRLGALTVFDESDRPPRETMQGRYKLRIRHVGSFLPLGPTEM